MRNKKKKRYLVEVCDIKTRLVYAYDYSADDAKRKVIKAVKNGTIKMNDTAERSVCAVSKGDNGKFIGNRKVIDLPEYKEKYNIKEE